jgi:threonine synthase
MRLYPTRGGDRTVSFCEAITSPSAPLGALYAPKTLPTIGDLDKLKTLNYAELARAIVKRFDVDLDDYILDEALKTYANFDDSADPAPLKKLNERLYVCELWHGPTRAFKDMALQPFGAILSLLAQKRGEKYLILAATSGDTGPATLATFADRANIEALCLYPSGGTSGVQELQMISQTAANLKTIAIKGDFDDAQNALKTLLASESFNAAIEKRGRRLSAANSVNFARITFQIVYHIYSYLTLLRRGEISGGEAIDVVVPSGNFGNALGAFYARKAGLPIAKIVIASNANNVLTDLIVTGKYDLRKRALIKTDSPAMDILKSSNVERVIFDLFGGDRTRALFESLQNDGVFELNGDELNALRAIFDATWSNEREVKTAMNRSAKDGYIVDPHTAVCFKAARLGEARVKVICSTAEWTKFAPALLSALGEKSENDRDALDRVSSLCGAKIPKAIDDLFLKKSVAPKAIAPKAIEAQIIAWLSAR